jgi:hypothetical protein
VVSPARCIAVAALLLAGCGRYRFDELERGDATHLGDTGGGDTSGDGDVNCGHTFCDDFDRAGPVEAGWDMQTTGGAVSGTAAIVSDMSISAPQSMLVSLPTDGVNTTSGTFLHKELPLATTKATIHVALSYATAMTSNTEADFVALQWNTLPAGCTAFGFYLVRDGTQPFNLQETYAGTGVCTGGSVQNTNLNLDNAGFKDVLMEITFGPMGTAHLKLSIDGTPVVDKPATHPIDPSTLRLSLGAGVSRNGLTPWEVRFDDVYVDIE